MGGKDPRIAAVNRRLAGRSDPSVVADEWETQVLGLLVLKELAVLKDAGHRLQDPQQQPERRSAAVAVRLQSSAAVQVGTDDYKQPMVAVAVRSSIVDQTGPCRRWAVRPEW